MFMTSTESSTTPRKSWRRLRPESVVVRWLVVLASVTGGVAAAIPVGQVVARWWQGRTADSSSTVAGATIEQGSPAADALVRQLFDVTREGRLELDAILVSTPSQAQGRATNGFIVFYNCDEGPGDPGADRCNRAQLYWQTNPLPSAVRAGAGWHLVGTYTAALDPNGGQIYDARSVVFALSSVR
jgi:hypothetical protein